MNKTKIAIVQRILAHYREPVFSLLCRQNDIEVRFFVAAKNTSNSVKTIDQTKADIPIDQGGLRWTMIKNHKLGNFFIWQSGILKIALSKHFDVIIFEGSYCYLSTWVAAVFARLSKKRVLMWGHGFLQEDNTIKTQIKVLFYRLAHGHLLHHNRAKEIMTRKGFSPENLHIIYNSLDHSAQVEFRKAVSFAEISKRRESLFQGSRRPVILFIGRLIPEKKLSMLLNAIKMLRDESYECNLLFVGDGPEKDCLNVLAHQYGLEKQVLFYGSCYNERENALLISMADVCVAPGEIGLTAMHALGYGTPVITHDDPCSQGPEYEAIRHGYNGVFFKKDDTPNLALSIRQWLLEHPDKQTVQKRCYEIIDKYYNPDFQLKVIRTAILGDAASENP